MPLPLTTAYVSRDWTLLRMLMKEKCHIGQTALQVVQMAGRLLFSIFNVIGLFEFKHMDLTTAAQPTIQSEVLLAKIHFSLMWPGATWVLLPETVYA